MAQRPSEQPLPGRRWVRTRRQWPYWIAEIWETFRDEPPEILWDEMALRRTKAILKARRFIDEYERG